MDGRSGDTDQASNGSSAAQSVNNGVRELGFSCHAALDAIIAGFNQASIFGLCGLSKLG
jgi:hypothetical protein